MNERNFTAMREAMIESQLRPSDVNDRGVLRAMATVPREEYVPETRGDTAYSDRSIPLGGGRALAPPLALGRMLVEADPVRGDRALIVGAATGYSSAVLAHLVDDIVALESDADLLALARPRLAGATGIRLVEGPLAEGYAEGAPYTLILVDGAIDHLPATLTDQLAEGGRLVCGLSERGLTRLAIARKRAGTARAVAFTDCEVPVLAGFETPAAFRF